MIFIFVISLAFTEAFTLQLIPNNNLAHANLIEFVTPLILDGLIKYNKPRVSLDSEKFQKRFSTSSVFQSSSFSLQTNTKIKEDKTCPYSILHPPFLEYVYDVKRSLERLNLMKRLMKKSRNIMTYAKAQSRQMFDKCYIQVSGASLLRTVKARSEVINDKIRIWNFKKP